MVRSMSDFIMVLCFLINRREKADAHDSKCRPAVCVLSMGYLVYTAILTSFYRYVK